MTSIDKKTKYEDLFNTDLIMKDIKRRSIRGGFVTISSQGAKFILELSSTMILARILFPGDYGLVAMVTAVTGFASLFKDLGLSLATIQRKEVTDSQISALFWVNVLVSLAIALFLCSIAPLLSRFYNESRLINITIVISITFVFSGLTVQHLALLRRQMKFEIIGFLEICSLLIGIVFSVVMAKLGYGYWALVGKHFFSSLAGVILVWLLCHWRPSIPSRRSGVVPMLKFGGNITSFNLVNYFSRNMDNILIGRFYGAEELGLYSKAYSIMMIPISQIRGPLLSVAIPVLSRMQNDHERYRRYYLKLVRLIAFLSMPLMVFLFVCAGDIVLLILGPNWTELVAIFKVLCFVAFIQPVASTNGLVLVSLGDSKRFFYWGLINGFVTVLSFLIGLSWGGLGVAMSYTVANYFLFIPALCYSFKNTPIEINLFLLSISGPFVASIIMGVGIWHLNGFFYTSHLFLSVSFKAIVGFLFYLCLFVFFKKGRFFLKELFLYKNFIFKGKA